MARRSTVRSRAKVFSFLVCLSFLALILPTPLTRSFSSLMQVLVPLQHGMSTLVAADDDVQDNSADQNEHRRHSAAQEHRIVALQMRIEELEDLNAQLTGIRDLGLRHGRLMPARVVAGDSLAWRESWLIDRGTLKGIRPGSPVISHFYVDVGEADGTAEGMMVLAAETLVGHIERAGTHTARVLRITDPASPPRLVKIAHRRGNEFELVPPDTAFMIYGLGGSRMEIRDVDYGFIQRKEISLNDLVIESVTEGLMPVPATIGRIVELRPDDDNRVLYRLVVEPELDIEQITRVFVVDNKPGS